jgi:hypothetical protein
MLSANHTRWTGLALIASGTLTAATLLIHPRADDPGRFASPLWAPIHLAILLALLLLQLGLVGLYRAHADRGGLLGLAAFLLSFVGAGLFLPAITLDAFVFPALITGAPALAAPDGPLLGGPLALVLLAASACFALGTLLLGIVTLRASALPRAASILIMVGGPLLSAAGLVPQIPEVIGGVLLGAGLVVAGYAVWSRAAGETQPITHSAQVAP